MEETMLMQRYTAMKVDVIVFQNNLFKKFSCSTLDYYGLVILHFLCHLTYELDYIALLE